MGYALTGSIDQGEGNKYNQLKQSAQLHGDGSYFSKSINYQEVSLHHILPKDSYGRNESLSTGSYERLDTTPFRRDSIARLRDARTNLARRELSDTILSQ